MSEFWLASNRINWKLINQIYFLLASILFFLSSYQVNIAYNVLVNQERQIPKMVVEAYRAGCTIAVKKKCPKELLADFAAGIYEIYSQEF